VRIKRFATPAAFEKVLLQFIHRNNVLHLSTCRNNITRTTPIEYRPDGFTFYILSEGGSKFNNLKVNKTVSFSIAEPYYPDKDYWGAKGLQAWGKAKVYNKKDNPRRFETALREDPPAIFLAWNQTVQASSRRFVLPPENAGRDAIYTLNQWLLRQPGSPAR
jgi:hypothetical protein